MLYWISAKQSEKPILEGMGVTLGEYQYGSPVGTFINCQVPSFDELECYWGHWVWGPMKYWPMNDPQPSPAFAAVPVLSAAAPAPAGEVYVDDLMTCATNPNWRWSMACHMTVMPDTDIEVLHAFAKKIGLKRAWFQDKSAVPHYDLNASTRERAVAAGALEIDRREMGCIIQLWRDAKSDRFNVLTKASQHGN